MSTQAGPVHRLLRASAGTGKTYQLVEAYVRCIEVHKLRPAQIVAITFTRKAAAELRLRVRAKLLAQGAPAPILAELARAPLGNFHGLALQLMGSLGLEAGLMGPLRVLGEAQQDRDLFCEACRDAWFAADAATSAAVQAVAPYLKVGSSLPQALWQAIALAREDDVPIGAALLARPAPAERLAQVHQQLVQARTDLLGHGTQMTAKALACITLFEQARVPACPKISGDWPSKGGDVDALAEGLSLWRQGWLAMFACLNRTTGIKKIYSAELQSWVKTTVLEAEADVLSACLTPAVGLLLEQAWRSYTRLKQERGVVDFVDIIARLIDLLETRDDLRAHIRARFGAILVDEAQDTNRLQRRMVDLLCGFARPEQIQSQPAASVFVVGDWKQSIYTFRGADAQSFDDFAEAIKARGGTETALRISRRSAPELVAGINSLGASLFGPRYEPLDALEGLGARAPNAAAPADAAPALAPAPAPGAYWLRLPVGPQAGAPKLAKIDPAVEARSLALWVKSRMACGAQPGDFAILLSAMTAAPAYLSALQRLGIPALLGGGGGFYGQAEIIDHIALLAWLADPNLHLQAAVCLRAPLFGLSDSALWALLGPDGRAQARLDGLRLGIWPPPAEACDRALGLSDDDCQALHAAAQILPALVAAAACQSVEDLLHTIDGSLDARAVYLGLDSGPQRVANIQRLWRFAAAHDKAPGASLAHFVGTASQRIDNGFKEPLAGVPAAGRAAVIISTVHQAKGLQYPIVVLPRLGAGGQTSQEALAYDRQEGLVFRPSRRHQPMRSQAWARAQARRKQAEDDERRRLLYVAITRAERELVFVGPPPENLGRPNFGALLKTWAEAAPPALTLLDAPAPGAPPAQDEAEALVLEVPDKAPPLHRVAPPGTHFRVTVTALAHTPLQDDAPEKPVARHAAVGAQSCGASPATLPPTALAADSGGGAAPEAQAQAQAEAVSALLAAADAPLSASAKGELAHAVLAAIGMLHEHESPTHFLRDMLGRLGYDSSDARVADVRRYCLAFLGSPLGLHITRLPAEARRHEMPFQLVLPCGAYGATLHGQLDLAYWDHDGLSIIDYKYAKAGDSADGYQEGYLRQLDAYACALAQLCQIKGDVKCYLVYLRSAGPPVQHTATPARQASVRQRLEGLVQMWARA